MLLKCSVERCGEYAKICFKNNPRAAAVETVWWAPQNIHVELPHDPAVVLLGMNPPNMARRDSNRYLYIRVHNSIIPNSQRVATA